MLVLSRKVGERITIGDDVQIVITRITGGRVAIGIAAPTDVAIRRDNVAALPVIIHDSAQHVPCLVTP